jgi:hypothetical protein
MRRAALCLAVILAAGPAVAAEGWTAQMQQDEGGPVLVAAVSGDGDAKTLPSLQMMCDGKKGVMLRYDMASDDGQPGDEADFLFENESTKGDLHMAYEAGDGAFAGYFRKTDPIVTLLHTGPEVTVSDVEGNYPAQTFTLAGSGKAIDAVLKGCK